MKGFIYAIIIAALLFGAVGLHAYFLNQDVCGSDAKHYANFYDLDKSGQWIINTGACSIAQPVTIDAGSNQHDILTEPFWAQKVVYLFLQIVSKGFNLVLG